MKKLLVILSFFFGTACYAQAPTSFIKPNLLDITSNKTSNIIFPYAIQHVDKGSNDILAQKVNGAANVLEVKAAKDSFAETNLSVITADGKLYSFIVNYTLQPSELNIVISAKDSGASPVFAANNARLLEENAAKVAGLATSVHGLRDNHDEIIAKLKGLYVKDDVFYFQLQFINRSNVSYGIDAIRFAVLDKRKSKRTATQETELNPVYSTEKQASIGAGTRPVIVIALAKFTLPDGKYLAVHVTEKDGGRDLRLRMGNKVLVRARTIR